MRTIAIAPRDQWVADPRPGAPKPPRSGRVRDWLATLPILLLVPALVLPTVGVLARSQSPSLTLDRATGPAGATVTVVGKGFDKREAGDVLWDGVTPLGGYTANGGGRFRIEVAVPAGSAAGAHEIVAAPSATAGTRDASDARAVAAFLVVGEAAPQVAVPATSTAAPTPAPTFAPTPAPTVVASVMPVASRAPLLTPSPAVTTSTPAPTTAPVGPAPTAASGETILMSRSQLRGLPMSGAAWTALKSRADSALGTPDISNQDDMTDVYLLAKALVFARTGGASYRDTVLGTLKKAVGTEDGGRTLALGRNLPGYVLSADLIDLKSVDAAFDSKVFRPWLRGLLTESLDGRTLRSTHEDRPNNWGTHAGAARAAVAAYLGDTAELARTATVFRGYLGDRAAYAGFKYGDLAWQCDPARPVGINPPCVRDGIDVGGALPEEMRRGGGLTWPPTFTGYAWEGLQGAMLQAEILRRAGYDAFGWSDRALLRAARYLYERLRWPAVGDDQWQPWLLDARYGTTFRAPPPARVGKNFGWTDWLYAG